MINLYRQQEHKSKNKTMFPVNKSHIASMNLKVNNDTALQETNHHEHLKNHTNRIAEE